MKREQTEKILQDLDKKMVFLVGPRQVGKTWIAKEIMVGFTNPVYLNYDRLEDRTIIDNETWPERTDLLIFDELHKKRTWENYIKGVFDTKADHTRILVTGSARLNTFRQSGDSLAGRFFLHRLLPLSIAELEHVALDLGPYPIDHFLERGGFPEPLLAPDEVEANRWRMQYIDGLIRNDVLDFENIHDLRTMQLLVEMLRQGVGSLLSYASLARDLQISAHTVKKYIDILEELFIVFRVYPYSKNIAQSLLKTPKLYFFDTGMVADNLAMRFENFVAVSLLKYVYQRIDYMGERVALQYMRTKQGKEVDFSLVHEDKVERLIEVKLTDGHISAPLRYFSDQYNLNAVQIVKELKREQQQGKIEVRRGVDFLAGLKVL